MSDNFYCSVCKKAHKGTACREPESLVIPSNIPLQYRTTHEILAANNKWWIEKIDYLIAKYGIVEGCQFTLDSLLKDLEQIKKEVTE